LQIVYRVGISNGSRERVPSEFGSYEVWHENARIMGLAASLLVAKKHWWHIVSFW